VRSKYWAAWAALHKHQGYPTCYGTALACQQDLDSTPPVTVPLLSYCSGSAQEKEKFFSRLGQNMEHKRKMGVVALCPVRFCLAQHMQNSESK
jgi:hypothetical protein